MQAVPNLAFLDFAQIGVKLPQAAVGVIHRIQADILVQPRSGKFFKYLFAQPVDPSRINACGFVVFIDENLQFAQVSVCFRARQGRRQMIDDYSLRAPLSLSALTRIIHNERINHRRRSENCFRETRVGQRDGFSGQPFKIAVLAHLDDCMGVELEPKPEIKCNVIVRRHKIGAVISFFRVKVVAPRRLDSDN